MRLFGEPRSLALVACATNAFVIKASRDCLSSSVARGDSMALSDVGTLTGVVYQNGFRRRRDWASQDAVGAGRGPVGMVVVMDCGLCHAFVMGLCQIISVVVQGI